MYDLIACGIFKGEIAHMDLDFEFRANYLDPGLHVCFDDLALELRSAISRCSADSRIIVAYGACHPHIQEMLPQNAALIDCQNCVDAIITREEVARRAAHGLYFYLSPGWLDCWRDIFKAIGYGMEEARMQLGPFKGAIYLDTIGDAADREDELMEFFDYTLLCVTVVPAPLDHLRSLIIQAKNRLGGISSLGRD